MSRGPKDVGKEASRRLPTPHSYSADAACNSKGCANGTRSLSQNTYQLSLAANCIWRGEFTCACHLPQLAFPSVVAPDMGPNQVRFRTLNASPRSSMRALSLIAKIRDNPRDSLNSGQLRKSGLYRVEFPNDVDDCVGKKDCGWR